MTQLTIIRGVPGAGKSTYAKTMYPTYAHFEADMYHINPTTGEYAFDPGKIKAAHNWCQRSVKASLEKGADTVVSNTFTQDWEIAPYVKMAKELGVSIVVVEMLTQYQNIHNVPEEAVNKMRARWHTFGEIEHLFEDVNAVYIEVA